MLSKQDGIEDRRNSIKNAITFYRAEIDSKKHVKLVNERMESGIEVLERRLNNV
jgi:hypothetical protein